jgi:hypothetical protein
VTRIPELEQELVAAAGRLRSPRRVLRPAARAALAAAVVAVVCLLVVVEATEKDHVGRGGQEGGTPPSQRGPKVGIDGQAGVRFSLEGRELTVRLLPYAPLETRQRLSSAQIRATCGVAFAQVGPESDPRNTRVERTRFWPAGRATLRFRFPLEIGSIARWCRVEGPAVGHVAFVRFGTATERSLSPEETVEWTANEWARLFAASDPAACERYMSQPACERVDCMAVGNRPVQNCTPVSAAFRRSFQNARVEEVAIERKFGGVRFSNGRTVQVIHVEGTPPDGIWLIEKFVGNPGSRFFEK